MMSMPSVVFVRPAVFLRGKTFNVESTHRLFSYIMFIPSVPIGTIDFCHLIPYVVTRSEGQRKAKPVGFIYSHTFQLNEIKFGMVMKQGSCAS